MEKVSQKIFREINSLVISLVETLLSRIFCKKCVRLNNSNFYTVGQKILTVCISLHHTRKIFREINVIVKLICNCQFHVIFVQTLSEIRIIIRLALKYRIENCNSTPAQ